MGHELEDAAERYFQPIGPVVDFVSNLVEGLAEQVEVNKAGARCGIRGQEGGGLGDLIVGGDEGGATAWFGG